MQQNQESNKNQFQSLMKKILPETIAHVDTIVLFLKEKTKSKIKQTRKKLK